MFVAISLEDGWAAVARHFGSLTSTTALAKQFIKPSLYVGQQIRPNQRGLTRAFNGGDFVVAKDWLSEKASIHASV